MATGNIYRKFREVLDVMSLRYASGQTDRYTDTLIKVGLLGTLPGGKVIKDR